MTYGVARAATAPELALYRTPGKFSRWYAAILDPRVVYTARINQTFVTTDGVLSFEYDTGSGVLAEVLPDMTLLIGSTAGAHDIGIVRLRDKDADTFFIGETSDVAFADNLYVTVLEDFSLWARHVKITDDIPYMDGSVAYSNQHSSPDPTPIMGSHRILKMTGANVSTQYNWANSYVIGGLSTITAYAASAPTASAISGSTTATPTITFDQVGWHAVYLTVTAANGKTFFGVRYVYVWNDSNVPPAVVFGNPSQGADTGGWEFEVTAFTGEAAGVSNVRDHALVILFSEDYFGNTQSNIGPVPGSENVVVMGWISKERIRWSPEQGSVTFTVYGAHYWFGQVPSYPDGVRFTASVPTAWTDFQSLTVDRGLWHFLHWRTTATRVMDVFLTGDTKLTGETSSMASNLWEQIREISALQIYARAGVNAWGQLFIQVHPQLVPEASRSWPTVMTLQEGDWIGEIDLDWITKEEVAVVSLSGIAVNESGSGAAYFSLAPGHAYPHYGTIDVQDHLLVEGQSQANILAGLYRSWRNNKLPDVPVPLKADIRLMDCFPRSKIAIALAEGDTPRGRTFSGNLIPKSITIIREETGYVHRDVSFEAETLQSLAINGDIPGSRADTTVPPIPSLPPLPPIPIVIPGTTEPSVEGPVKVLMHDTAFGLVYTENFNAVSPTWKSVNAGLGLVNLGAANFLAICPNGAVYLGYIPQQDPGSDYFLARAPYIGGTFVAQTLVDRLRSAAINPTVPESIGFGVAPNGGTGNFYVGANNSFTSGVAYGSGETGPDILSFGLGHWLVTHNNVFGRISANGQTVVASGAVPGISPPHLRPSTIGDTYGPQNGADGWIKMVNNLTSYSVISTGNSIILQPSLSPNCGACDPTGNLIMTRGLGGGKARTNDGGSTWSPIPNLPPGNWYFAYAGGAGSESRWIATSGSQIFYTENYGDDWASKLGNYLSIIPLPSPRMIRVVQM
jgi:hypothetical protein